MMRLILRYLFSLVLQLSQLVGPIQFPVWLIPTCFELRDGFIAFGKSLNDDIEFLGLCRYELLPLVEGEPGLRDLLIAFLRYA